MLLCVDVGNSHTVSGVFKGNQLVRRWRLKSDKNRTIDELAIRYHSLFQMAGLCFDDVSGFIVAGVVPTLETSWLGFAKQYLALGIHNQSMVVTHETETGIKVLIDNPKEVGADRIVNAVAAHDRFHNDLIVIDFGTAITFDCVTRNKEYRGGVILPGIAISLDALAMRTAKLPRVDISQAPTRVTGTNTVDAIRSGVLHGYGGMIDRMVERLASELFPDNESVDIIATGGMGRLIAPYSESIGIADPLLTLTGLRLIYERNKETDPQGEM